MCKNIAKPFLKWAGGKGQILNKIRPLYPKELGSKINKYIEPFIGGGAVFFDVVTNYKLDTYIINDINKELINTYKAIQQDINSLLGYLSNITSYYKQLSIDDKDLFYYSIRKKYNNIIIDKSINIEKAALFIFLNKTCFNGLYRVNRNNQFNVPTGKYKNPTIYDEENLLNISQILQKVEILCGDFSTVYNHIESNTFIYIDPPYRPLTKTSSFTNYSTYLFDDKEQIRLSTFINEADKKGAYVLASNSDPKNTSENDLFFDELYSSKNIIRIEAQRAINSNPLRRGKITELIISNY